MTRPSLTSLFAAAVVAATFATLPAAEPAAWPQWRGPDRTGISPDTGLAREWPEGGPPVVWKIDNVGVGYSSLAVKDGRLFTQGDLDGVEHVIAVDVETGKRLWAVQPEPVAQALAQRIDEDFAKADENGDGRIDQLEAITRFGWKFTDFDQPGEGNPLALAEVRAAELMKAWDENGDGRLTDDELRNDVQRELDRIDQTDEEADVETLADRRTKAYLKEVDANEDGKITRDESRRTALDRPFNRIDKRDPTTRKGDDVLTAEEIQAYLERFEAGKDGLVSREELQDYFAKRHAGRDGVITRDELAAHLGGYRNGQGDGPRGTPTVDGDFVYAEGGNGDVTCFEAATGKTVWHVNLAQDLGGNRPGWGYSESPLIVGDLLIVTPGGRDGTLVALDKKTGATVWRTDDLTQSAHYASPVVATIGGVKQIVQFARESVFGVSLDDGTLLWQYSGANNGTANAATPIVDGDLVFTSSAYGTGGGLAKIDTAGSTQKAEEVYFSKEMANHHGGIVKVGEHMYGFGNGGLICMNFETGEIAWRDRSVGKGSLVAADGLLFLLGERHQVALAEATPEEYRELGRFEIEDHGRRSWAHPVVIGGRLYIRNQHTLTSYDVTAKNGM